MSRRMWTGLLAGLLAVAALVAVGAGAFHAGERHSVMVAPVTGAAGDTVRVVGYGGHWGGPPFGFLVPLLIIGIVVVLIAGRRRAYWGHPYGPGWGAGPCGPGPGREAMLADWHRRAHDEPVATTAGPEATPPGEA